MLFRRSICRGNAPRQTFCIEAMKILFIHQNFPGQFKHLAPALLEYGHEVRALTIERATESAKAGILVHTYSLKRGTTVGIHPWVVDFETKTIRAEACFRAAIDLRSQGYTPDVIVAHPGWGESLFLKDVWPDARLGVYAEFFYHSGGADVGFDSEFASQDQGDVCRLRLKNLNNLLHFEVADAGLSPTRWQASTFPETFRSKITVVHDGIDTDALKPDPEASMTLDTQISGKISLSTREEVITFVNRNLEPYRGYHTFMRALPDILRRRPKARVLIVGGNDVSYGSKPDPAKHGATSWREVFVREVRPQIPDADWARVHFLGKVPYSHFVKLLQLSRVHVYLTYPFVLSWSLLEAMSVGCAIVGSDTAPVREVIAHNQTGRLVDFFDMQALSNEVCDLLDDAITRQKLGHAARENAIAHYDLKSVCLPAQLAWVDRLIRQGQ